MRKDIAVVEQFLAIFAIKFIAFNIITIVKTGLRPIKQWPFCPEGFKFRESLFFRCWLVWERANSINEILKIHNHFGEIITIMIVFFDFEREWNFFEGIEFFKIPRIISGLDFICESDFLLLQIEAQEFVVQEIYIDVLPISFIRSKKWFRIRRKEYAFLVELFVDDLHLRVLSCMLFMIILNIFQSLREVNPNIWLTIPSNHTLFTFKNQQLFLSSTIEILQ